MARTKRSYRLNPRFKLDNQNTNVIFTISSRLFPSGRFTYSLGIPVKSGEWDNKNGRFRTGKTFPNGDRRNKVLKNILSRIQEVIERGDGTSINRELLRDELDSLMGRVFHVSKKEFLDFYLSEIERNTRSRKPQSIKALKTTFNLLKSFESETRYHVSFSSISLDFYSKFTKWLNGRSYSKNYVGKAIRNIRTILNMAEELNYPVNPDFHKKSFKVLREESDNVYLTNDELDLLKSFEFNDPSYERCRDLLLFLCYTALRISDAKRITAAHIFSDHIKIKAQKTNDTVIIPLSQEVKDILKKYNNILPRFADQYFNRLIKQVCKLTGIDSKVNISKTLGGLRVDVIKSKWELVSSHTGRRTFATNKFLEGVTIQLIMAHTGHKTEAVFRQYIKADQLTIIRELNYRNG